MKHSFALSVTFFLYLCAPAQADDANDCNLALTAPDAAIPACTRLLENAPDENKRKLLVLRSRAYSVKKQFDAALSDVSQIAIIAPNQDMTIAARAFVHARMKDYEAEDADYTEILKQTPNSFFAIFGRCNERSVSKRDAHEALADCNAAIAASAKPGPSLCARGMAYLRLNRFKDALTDYDLAVRSNVPLAKCYFGRGIARLHFADTEGGKDDMTKGVAILPDVTDDFTPFGLIPQ